MVFQHFSLFDTLTVTENIALGLDNAGPMDQLAGRIREVSERYGLALDPAATSSICRWASASGWRSCAVCCRIRSC